MDSDMIMLELTDKMDKAIESLDKRFATVRAGRANPSSLDGIMVEYYGSMTPLKQLATISVPEARQLLIKPFDKSLFFTLFNDLSAVFRAKNQKKIIILHFLTEINHLNHEKNSNFRFRKWHKLPTNLRIFPE